MKRILLFALPVLATFTVIGLGFFLLRPGLRGLRPRIDKARETLAEAMDVVADEPMEVIE